jgi:hypothetical protein
MNEKQTTSASAGLGSTRAGREQVRPDYSRSGSEDFRARRTFARSHDETTRAGQRVATAQKVDAWNERDVMPILAVGVGALLTGWLLGGISGSSRREETWPEETRSSRRRSIPIDETRDLIASNKVEGTAVYDRDGNRLGSVYNFMVGKRSGQVGYAVLSFGGWLGLGERYHPLPWDTLTYDTDLGGYVTGLTKERLRGAPSHTAEQDIASDADYWRQVRIYWS